jgi:ribonucleoside-diphosphate reductase alpha chain
MPRTSPAADRLVRRRLCPEGRRWDETVGWVARPVELHDHRGAVAFAAADVEAPEGWSPTAVATVARRYLGRLPDGRPERSVRAMVGRVVGTIAGWARAAGHVRDEEGRRMLADELGALVVSQRAAFATPVWLNVGLEDRPVASACFILAAGDSIADLLSWNTSEGLIFQQGAGSGVNLSRVRSSREPVSRGGLASGPVSFMRATDAWAATIRSGGRARRGAKMVVLDAGHPDVREFIRAKAREEERGRALVAAGYSVEEAIGSLAFQHANHAVRVSDEFMRAAAARQSWPLRAVTTGDVVETVAADELLRACADAAWTCGDPGLQFADAIDAWHTCPRSGPITASNPCSEFLHLDDSACNLATLNLLAFAEEGGRFDVEGLVHAVDMLVLAQDAIVDGAGYPTEAIGRNARRFRPLGLGSTNLAGLLLTLGIAYDSDEGRAWAASLAALMTGAAYRRSAELAEALGPFEEFARNREPMLAVIERHRRAVAAIGPEAPEEILSAARAAWDEAAARGRRHGFRNAQTTLVAPTGTVSLMLDCETTGIEPYFALSFTKRLTGGGEVRLAARALVDGLFALGYPLHHAEALCLDAAEKGHLTDAAELRPADRAVFQTATGPDPLSAAGHVAMVAAVQPLVSGGVSKTVLVPQDASADDVARVFTDAWQRGLKAVAVYRQGSKLAQPLVETDA